MKSVELFSWQIGNSSQPGEVVLDSFGGSGTTLIACEQLGRRARLMELEPKSCDCIVERYVKLTGKNDDVFVMRGGSKISYKALNS